MKYKDSIKEVFGRKTPQERPYLGSTIMQLLVIIELNMKLLKEIL